MSIETSFFSSKAPKERKVCIAKWHRNWNGPHAERFAPSDPKAVDWKAAYRKDLESRFPTPSSLRLYLQEIEKRTPDPILCCFELNPAESAIAGGAPHSSRKTSTWTVPSGTDGGMTGNSACCRKP